MLLTQYVYYVKFYLGEAQQRYNLKRSAIICKYYVYERDILHSYYQICSIYCCCDALCELQQ